MDITTIWIVFHDELYLVYRNAAKDPWVFVARAHGIKSLIPQKLIVPLSPSALTRVACPWYCLGGLRSMPSECLCWLNLFLLVSVEGTPDHRSTLPPAWETQQLLVATLGP